MRTSRLFTAATLFITALLAPSAGAQTAASAAPAGARPASQPAPRAADVSSADAILAAVYSSISGAAGEKRDWDRFRSLFVPGARLIPTGGPAGQPARAQILTPDDYVQRAGPALERDGFYETEIGRTSERFGRIMHAFSAYESRRAASDPKPFSRGINSIQLLDDGTRWWVVSIYWDAERPDNPIPAKYLGKNE